MACRGTPRFIRLDNGPEFKAQAARDRLVFIGIDTLVVEPGSPWENGYVESFNGPRRDELLNREIFHVLFEAKVMTGDDSLLWTIDTDSYVYDLASAKKSGAKLADMIHRELKRDGRIR